MSEEQERLIESLRKLKRYNAGTADDGGGYLYDYADESKTGDWIKAIEIDELISELEKPSSRVCSEEVQQLLKRVGIGNYSQCLFCQSDNQTIESDDDETKWCFWVRCQCGARGPTTGWYRDQAEGEAWALRLWNREATAITAYFGVANPPA